MYEIALAKGNPIIDEFCRLHFEHFPATEKSLLPHIHFWPEPSLVEVEEEDLNHYTCRCGESLSLALLLLYLLHLHLKCHHTIVWMYSRCLDHNQDHEHHSNYRQHHWHQLWMDIFSSLLSSWAEHHQTWKHHRRRGWTRFKNLTHNPIMNFVVEEPYSFAVLRLSQPPYQVNVANMRWFVWLQVWWFWWFCPTHIASHFGSVILTWNSQWGNP